MIFLTKEKVSDIIDYQAAYTLIEIIDRGSLKWTSQQVLDIILKLWSIYIRLNLTQNYSISYLRNIHEVFSLFSILRENTMKYGRHSVQAVKPSVGTYLRNLFLLHVIAFFTKQLQT